MQRLFVVTIWSGGRACKKWKTLEKPELLAQGTGVRFKDIDTKLSVEVVGTVSVEEYEQGFGPAQFDEEWSSGAGTRGGASSL